MACDITQWINGEWHLCPFSPVTNLVGEGVFGLLIGVGVYAGFYYAANGDVTAPTVVTILLAAMMFPILPTAYVGIAWSILVVGAAAAILQVFQKYVLSPATA